MLRKFYSDELKRGALILLVMINLFWFLNFLFHFAMGRLLGPEKYGVLAVLMAVIGIYGVPTEAIQNLIANYTSQFNSKNEYGKIKYLMFKSMSAALKISFWFFMMLGIVGIGFSYFVGINFWLVFLVNVMIFSAFTAPIVRGILQGRKKFGLLGMSMVTEAVIKLAFAIGFVIIGFQVFGAILGVLIGIFVSLLFTIYVNKKIIDTKIEKTSFRGIYPKSLKYFITMFVVLLVFSLDIILAKRFFDPELAGKYAVLSMIGKMIFFGTVAIGKAMFPLTSETHNDHKNSFELFKKALILIIVISVITIGLFWLFPKLIISLLYGGQYIEMAPYLVYSGISFSFLAISNLILIYSLSINAVKKPFYLILFLIIEIVLLSVYSNNIQQYITAFMVSNIIMFIGTLLLFLKWRK